MKDYNFMISDGRLHKTRFCKKKGRLTKTFLMKTGVGAKGGLERFGILGRVWPERGGGGDFFKRGSYPGAHYVLTNSINLWIMFS